MHGRRVVAMVTIDRGIPERLAGALRGRRSNEVSVVDVAAEWQFDRDDEEYLDVTLILSPPPTGADSWSVDDTYQLRMMAREEAESLGLDIRQYKLYIRTSGDSQTAD
jgi:hypothetical protein